MANVKQRWVLQGEWDAKAIEDGTKRTGDSFSKLDATISSFFGNLGAQLASKTISAGFSAIEKSIAGVTNEFKSWIKEASQDAMIRGRLDATLKTLGKSFDEYADRIGDAEDATYRLGKLTGGETQKAMLGLLQYTDDVNLAMKSLPAAVEFAGSGFQTLDGAIMAIGKTFNGFIDRDLGRMIPELKNLTQEQLAAGAGAELIRAKFEGMAQANLQTTIPSFERLKATLGDLRGTLGSEADSVIAKQLNQISDAIRSYAQSGEAAEAARLIGSIAQNGMAALAQALGTSINGKTLAEAFNDVLSRLNSYVSTNLATDIERAAAALMAVARAIGIVSNAIVNVASFSGGTISGSVDSVGYATGGMIPGVMSLRDNMRADLAGGEYVMNPVASARYRWMLEAMNASAPNPAGSGGRGLATGGSWEAWRETEIARLSRKLQGRNTTMFTGTLRDQGYYFDEILLGMLAGNASPESILATAQNNLNYQKSGLGGAIGNTQFFNFGGYWDRVKLNVSRFANLGSAQAMVAGQAKMSLADMLAASGGSTSSGSNLVSRLNSSDDMVRGQAEIEAYGRTSVNMTRGLYGPEMGVDYAASVYQRGLAPLSENAVDLNKYRIAIKNIRNSNPYTNSNIGIQGPPIDLMMSNGYWNADGTYNLSADIAGMGVLDAISGYINPGKYGRSYGNPLVAGRSGMYQTFGYGGRSFHSGGIVAGMGTRRAYTSDGVPIDLQGGEEIVPRSDPRHSAYSGGGTRYASGGGGGGTGIRTNRVAGGFQGFGGGRKAAPTVPNKAALPPIIIMAGDAAAGAEIKRRLRIGSHIDLDAIDETLTAQYAR